MDLACNYDAQDSAPHSPAIGLALDGKLLHGKWEGGGRLASDSTVARVASGLRRLAVAGLPLLLLARNLPALLGGRRGRACLRCQAFEPLGSRPSARIVLLRKVTLLAAP